MQVLSAFIHPSFACLRLVGRARDGRVMRFFSRVVVWLIAVLPLPVSTVADTLPRSVLIFDQSEPNAPWGIEFRAALRSTFNANATAPVTIYSEVLDLARFNSKEYEELLRSYLREKYRNKPIGVILVHGSLALDILMRLRVELWSTVPVVFGVVDEETVARLNLPPDVTGTILRLRFANAVNPARALVPNLKRIALVGDSFERQPFRRHFSQELPQFAKELEIIDLSNVPMAKLKERLAGLPDDAAIIYTAIYVDSEGVTYISRDALIQVAESANRPIFSDTETHIGYGATGGFVAVSEPIAEASARLALRILNGENVTEIPITTGDFTRPIFDWRQLQRFGISENRLPPGSEVRFRPQNLWEQYRWQLVAISAALAIQAIMISGLLFERRRRRVAELESRGHLLEVFHLNRTATAGALSASIAHELNQPLGAILSNAETAEILLKASPPDLNQVKEIVADIRRDDQRASDVIRHLRGLLKKSDIRLQEFDLSDAIHSTLNILEPEAAKRGIALKANQANGNFLVRADQVHVQQVMLNLAMNGMDAMQNAAPSARKMTIQTALVGQSEVEVSIADSGTGIPNDKLKSIFDTFVTTKPQGTGLGLSIARSIIEIYGGKIWAENRTAGGAVFRFTLPLAKAQSA
jgi:signal transduction histidine kinase